MYQFCHAVSELVIHSLPYATDLIAHYQAFADLPGFALLESGDQHYGRYDIMTALPYDELNVPVNSPNLEDCLAGLQSMLPRRKAVSSLPFQGGALGFISYNFGAHLAGISGQEDLALLPYMVMPCYAWAIIADHHQQEIFLIVDPELGAGESLIPDLMRRWYQPQHDKHTFILTKSLMPLITKAAYQTSFAQIQADLRQGRIYQVNYTQPFVATYTGSSWEMYKRIRQQNRVPFAAFLRTTNADILSFSPERFVRKQGQHVLTSPIKGTIRRDSRESVDAILRQQLLHCSKNRAENVMIVDLMRNDFGKFAIPGSVEVTALCELASFPALHHLVSHITAHCPTNIDPFEVFAACFPGGSITGAPKREAMRVIAECEPYARGIYCGSIGYFSNHGSFDTNIAIRTLTVTKDTIHLAAGGGIVLDSQCSDEYQECLTKIEAIRRALE